MSTFFVQNPTFDALEDLSALHFEQAEVAAYLTALRGRVVRGEIGLDQMLILRSERGLEGTVVIADDLRVPILPRFRLDTPAEGMTALSRAIREQVGTGRLLVLQDAFAPLNTAAIAAAGWVLQERHVMYETDLQGRSYRRDPHTVEGGAELLSRPDFRLLLKRIGWVGYDLPDGWTLVALAEAGELLALGATGSTFRPGYEPTAVLDMLGVLPEARGRGLGTRLYEHLLALAAEEHTQHVGGTAAENAPMRCIFEKNGSRWVGTQLIFQPD